MADWRDRVNEVILLVSPSGLNFWASWAGDKRSVKKKLGVFEFPMQRGAVVQDLDVGPKDYPLTFYFSGADHDVNAEHFFSACNERGPWKVTHPTKGNLTLQLVSVTEDIQPITSGNITQFSTEWIEVGMDISFISTEQLSAEIREQTEKVKDSLSLMEDLSKRAQDFTTYALKKIMLAYTAYSAVMQVYQTAQSLIAGAAAAVSSVVGVITAIVSAPANVLRDTKSRFAYYKSAVDTSFRELNLALYKLSNGPNKASTARNLTVATSIVNAAVLNGMALEIVDAGMRNKKEALAYLDSFNDTFSSVTDQLDAVQNSFSDVSIADQYISFSESYQDLVQLRKLVNSFIMRRLFDLSSTRYITLQSNRTPVEIAITESVDLDIFIEENNLHGSDILLLPAGRVVAVSL